MIKDAIYPRLGTPQPPYKRTQGDVQNAPRRDGALLRRVEGRSGVPGVQSPSLMSSFSGAIARLLFVFPNWAIDDHRFANAYRSVIRALRQGTEFIVVVNRGTSDTVAAWFEEAGHAADNVTIVSMPPFISLTDWAEDAYVTLTDREDGTVFLSEPWTFLRAGDALIADEVAGHRGIQDTQSPLIFQGGNCLIGDDFWLLGLDYVADTIDLLVSATSPIRVPGDQDIVDFTYNLFSEYLDHDRELIALGTNRQIPIRTYHGSSDDDAYYLDIVGDGMGFFQPIFHIDMFITLVGRNDQGEFVALVASPEIGEELTGETTPYSYQYAYDEIADDLERRGFKVVRNPLVVKARVTGETTLAELRELTTEPDGQVLLDAIRELEAAGAGDDTPLGVREFHHITWNNCLVENRGEEKIVYLPSFGHEGSYDEIEIYDHRYLSVVDDHMANLWECELGFTPRMLGDFNPFAVRQGVVHCIKKYLARGD